MTQQQKRLFKMSEAAEYSGFCKATLYTEARNGRLKILKIGGATRIETTELDRWVDMRISESDAA